MGFAPERIRSLLPDMSDADFLFIRRSRHGEDASCRDCGHAGETVSLSDGRWWSLPADVRVRTVATVLAARIDPSSGMFWYVRALGQLSEGDVLSFARPWDFGVRLMCARLDHYGVVERVEAEVHPGDVVPRSSAVARVRLVTPEVARRAVLDMAMSRGC